MAHIITQNIAQREDWLYQLADVITDPDELLRFLSLQDHPELVQGHEARRLFPLRVPRAFAARIKPGDSSDPLLLQVLTSAAEFIQAAGFSTDPLAEQANVLPSLLHKYHNRVLLLVKGGCAVNCRYCFRRHFPYQDNAGSKANLLQALEYIRQHPELDEVIFSGGDPLMAKDHELEWLISELETIAHLKRLRIHTRLPVVIPARVTTALCQRLSISRFQVVMVTHINHANEIDQAVASAMAQLRQAGVTLLNQSVLLRGVNDSAASLAALSQRLFEVGILPYYLHLLDKVQGAAHFLVSDDEARLIMKQLLAQISGYLVPRLTREIAGEKSKTPLDLYVDNRTIIDSGSC
ncbi:EF-P beta-lysylation protein EpmB [Serratia microhaemolytica]|uniref:EF-P beta-lysylation protein EpmB n=1 Tax=Serratia microhaemolytica TaxID=2675110 RepID=UPI000FDE6E33|nr:EF-P beta-lysylation protein EpmB [Serratia microhaemolytica]